jgi:hypothetical protein
LKPAPKASTGLPVMRIYEAPRTPFSVYNSDNARLLDLFRFGIKLDKGRYGKYTLAALDPTEPSMPW